MANELDEQSLLTAFDGRTDLQGAIRNAAASPQYVELFNCISTHIINLLSAHSTSNLALKKRKLVEENGLKDTKYVKNGNSKLLPANDTSGDDILLEVDNISFIIPQRKKFKLCLTNQYLYARSQNEQIVGTRLLWKEIEYAFLLPIPEKTQKQHGILLFPYNSCCTFPKKPLPDTALPPEPIVFTIPSTGGPKTGSLSGTLAQAASTVSDDYINFFLWALKARLENSEKNIPITLADEKIFSSAQKQSHHPNEKAVWVKAFRGSKEGYLYFLPNGIIWAFKKPLLFLPHNKIAAISFTSVLTRTFNLTMEISMDDKSSVQNEQLEFSMLEQEDFENINRYINRHGLQDRSMTERHRAKVFHVNVTRDENGGIIYDAESSELIKAGLSDAKGSSDHGVGILDMMDDEDDDEEDYDPGSEGESEGSGTSSEEEGEDYEDSEDGRDDGMNESLE